MVKTTTKNIVNENLNNLVTPQVGRQIAKVGTDSASEVIYNSYQENLDFMKQRVSNYRKQFETDFEDYKKQNGLKKALSASMSTGKKSSSAELDLSKKKVYNNLSSTKKLISTMQEGHQLLLDLREELTGQKIKTKFIIQYQGKIYQVKEDQINPKYALSLFGGDTVSNPFSVAYSIDKDLLVSKGLLSKENEITKDDIFQKIMSLKRPYLDDKSLTTGRTYENVFFDSKDAEIIELYQQQIDSGRPVNIDLAFYKQKRASMGGGGGYATPFYKMGDIGDTQIKYVNFSNGNKTALINFGRFSLLRDKFLRLENILSSNNKQTVITDLQNFFTEKNSNIGDDISKEFNAIAKREILKNLTK